MTKQNNSCLEVAFNKDFKSRKQSILYKHFLDRLIIIASQRTQAVNFSLSLRIFMHQGRRGNKITGAIKGYYTTEDRVISIFYTVYSQKDFI